MLINQSLIHAISFFTTEVTTYFNYYRIQRGAVSPETVKIVIIKLFCLIILIETIKMTIIITTITMEEESTHASQSS